MTIHVLAAEAMLITAAFLFCKIRLDKDDCIGCAACELICPTGALEAHDGEGIRSFTYSHYQCVCCGACVRTCPEGAAELRHEIGVGNMFRLFSKDAIRNIELSACRRCGAPYLPSPLLGKVGTLLADDFIHFCPTCKTAATAETLYLKDPRCSNPSSTPCEQHLPNGDQGPPEPNTILGPT
jgi:Pyruvate/2-oxoacid:ferredoxin oxidoreductase delta subunit